MNQKDNQPLSLSQLTAMIKNTLREQFGSKYFYVVAEVSNFSARKGVHYMQLIEKDEHTGNMLAEVSAMMFQDSLHEMEHFTNVTGQTFGNGIKVLLKVSVNYHEVYGLKLFIHGIDTSFTIGELRKQREQTLKRLCEENPDAVKFLHNRYYTRNQTHKLPLAIHRIALVSSEFSAGLQDFNHTLAHNTFGYKFETTLFPTKVQNDEQGKQTAERFLEIYKRLDEFDVVVLVRGGGSQTDLNMFDAYPLARVIARFPIPVFCGLGHLKDISVADLMAHTSEKTPTRVAEKIIEHNRSFEQSILDLQNNIVIRTQQLLHMQNERLSGISSFISQRSNFTLAQNTASIFDISSRITGGSIRLVHEHKSGLSAIAGRMSSRPLIQIDKDFNELLNLQKAVFAGSEQMLRFKKGLLEHHVTVFRLLSPEKTLARGFALVKKDGKILTSAATLRKGDELEVLLGSDIIQTKVTDKKKKDGSKNDL